MASEEGREGGGAKPKKKKHNSNCFGRKFRPAAKSFPLNYDDKFVGRTTHVDLCVESASVKRTRAIRAGLQILILRGADQDGCRLGQGARATQLVLRHGEAEEAVWNAAARFDDRDSRVEVEAAGQTDDGRQDGQDQGLQIHDDDFLLRFLR